MDVMKNGSYILEIVRAAKSGGLETRKYNLEYRKQFIEIIQAAKNIYCDEVENGVNAEGQPVLEFRIVWRE